MKLSTILLAGLAATAATGAQAQSYTNNFDSENGGQTELNYSGFNGLTVTRGSVDLIGSPNGYGIACAGGSGSCVDLDGTTGTGGELQTASYAFNAGDLVTLSFDLSGSQRGDGPNPFDAGFRFSDPTGLATFHTGGGYGNSTVLNVDPLSQTVYSGTSNSGDPFQTFTLTFRATTGGSVAGYVGTSSNDNIGPILDNLSLTNAGVPEPATWAMMVLGFGMVGFGLRYRRKGTKVSFV